MRRVFLGLSVASVAVGIWLIVRVHPLSNSCTNGSPLTGAGLSTDCQNRISIYFFGFALIVGGLIAAALFAISMVRHSRRRDEYRGPVRRNTPTKFQQDMSAKDQSPPQP